jgi:hypothetical protein
MKNNLRKIGEIDFGDVKVIGYVRGEKNKKYIDVISGDFIVTLPIDILV